jgi:hypothetical protein
VRYEFDWDPAKDRRNVRDHRVAFRQAATVFRDPNQLSLFDEDHSEDDEDRWITIGLDSTGVLRVVVHLFEPSRADIIRIRIISARKATSSEARQYREANS